MLPLLSESLALGGQGGACALLSKIVHEEADLYRDLPGAGRRWRRDCSWRSAPCAPDIPTPPACKNTPESHRSPSAVVGRSGSTGDGTLQSSSAKPGWSGPVKPSPNPPGPERITSSKNVPASTTRRSCAHSRLNGSASSGGAGRTACRMTNLVTSNLSSAKNHRHEISPRRLILLDRLPSGVG